MHRADVGMRQGSGSAGLAQKALAQLTGVALVEARHLEGHLAVELRVVRQVDRAHSSLAELTNNPVASQLRRLVGWDGGFHGIVSSGGRHGQGITFSTSCQK